MSLVIDAHTHFPPDPAYPERLLKEYDRLGIDKVCVSGLGAQFNMATNDDVERAFKSHPDRIIGFGYFRLGRDNLRLIDRFVERGFKGVKFTCPMHNYDDYRYDPIYARIEEVGLPALFHSCIIWRNPNDKEFNVSSDRVRPVLLDRVARTFPKMQMILAHLGMPWHSEAAEMPRFHPNLVVDLTGSMGGWRAHTPPEKFKEWFWWPRALETIVFGTDVFLEEVETVYKRDRELCRLLGLDKAVEDKIFGGTMARILKLVGF